MSAAVAASTNALIEVIVAQAVAPYCIRRNVVNVVVFGHGKAGCACLSIRPTIPSCKLRFSDLESLYSGD